MFPVFQGSLPAEYPSLEWIRSFKLYREEIDMQGITDNIDEIAHTFFVIHKDGSEYSLFNDCHVFSKRIYVIFSTELLIYNKSRIENDTTFPKISSRVLNILNTDPTIDTYIVYANRMLNPELKKESRKKYIIHVLKNTLCEYTASRIADYAIE